MVLALLGIALSVFGLAYAAAVRTTSASTGLGAVSDQARRALNELDRQVRSGYWVKGVSVPGASSAVQVLTQNTNGSLECWVWALDTAEGSLVTFHYPEPGPAKWKPLAFGGWHVVAGPEGDALRDVTFGSGSALTPVNSFSPLLLSNFSRPSLFQGAQATLNILRADLAPVVFEFSVSVRNQWRSAEYSAGCD